MKGLDTNVLVRYLVQDDPQQTARATRFVEQECSPDAPGHLSHIVLCELVWVLESCYDQNRAGILRVLEAVLGVAELEVESPATVWLALDDYRSGKADFSDHLLARSNGSRGCETTVTFDGKAASSPGFEGL